MLMTGDGRFHSGTKMPTSAAILKKEEILTTGSKGAEKMTL